MRTTLNLKKLVILFGLLICVPNVNAQILKKLKKTAERAAERKLEEKVDRETSKGMDSVLNPNDKKNKEDSPSPPAPPGLPEDKRIYEPNQNKGGNPSSETSNPNISDNLEIYSKYDFVPGDKQLFFDDFSQDFVGDFPSKWNTNGSGEVVRINNNEGNWFEFKAGYNIFYLPLLEADLPEEYTIEFDVLVEGLDNKTSSNAKLSILIDDNGNFKEGVSNMANTLIPFGQYAPFGFTIQNKINNKRVVYSVLDADIRDEVLNKPHISIAVNKRRFRLWVNTVKYVDVPQLAPEGHILTHLKFALKNFKDGKERLFIKNLKIAEGGLDLRRTLMSEGKVSTNGILFDSGSDNIQPQSYGIIRQISQVLMQDENINLLIVGHTDSDGKDDTNLKLSQARAEAVKSALIEIYKISGNRLNTDGKGEMIPVADNTTSEGKAQNRRVEFIKQ